MIAQLYGFSTYQFFTCYLTLRVFFVVFRFIPISTGFLLVAQLYGFSVTTFGFMPILMGFFTGFIGFLLLASGLIRDRAGQVILAVMPPLVDPDETSSEESVEG